LFDDDLIECAELVIEDDFDDLDFDE
jgi:hypothetical protein